MKRLVLSLAALMLLIASCTNDLDNSNSLKMRAGEAPVFYATIEGSDELATKVYADADMRVLWNKNDDISIFNKTTGNQQYRFTGRTGANAGSFKPISGEPSVTPIDHIYALYPYDEATTISAGGVISLTLPAIQTYKENSFGIGANTMLSVSDDYKLLFRNVCGYLAFKFYGDDISVKSITLQGNNHEKLAGAATVTMPLNGIPTVQMQAEATEQITLNCDTPVALSADANDPTLFWFVLPPTSFTKGVTVTVTDAIGGVFEMVSAKAFDITRSNLSRKAALKVTPNYDNVNIPFEDDNFKAYCVENFDTDNDGEISGAEAKTVTAIDVNTNNITSLGGVEYFNNLETLRCRGSAEWNADLKKYIPYGTLKDLNVSKNKALTELNCSYNQLTELDVSNNTKIFSLHCYYNNLTSLSIGPNGSLTKLYCYNNQLTSLDVSNNTGLVWIYCGYNSLKALDVSNNPNLNQLDCDNNLLTSLNVSNNAALNNLYCGYNQLTELDVSKISQFVIQLYCFNNPSLKVIWLNNSQIIQDLRYDTDVATIQYKDSEGNESISFSDPNFKAYCVENFDTDHDEEISYLEARAVTSINVNTDQISSLSGIGYFINLTSLICRGSHTLLEGHGVLSDLDISALSFLTELDCSYNQLSSLDISKNGALTQLQCGHNQLSSLDVSNNMQLTQLLCVYNQLTELDISKATALTLFACSNNQLTSLDVSNNTNLLEFYCHSNQLTGLNLSKNTKLTLLYCPSNQLTSLDVSKNVALEDISCFSNPLISLIVGNNKALTGLNCRNTQLKNLDVSGCTSLTSLLCYDSQLENLSVSGCAELRSLNCNNNQLEHLYVNKNTNLTSIKCNTNHLTSLDVSNLPSLSYLDCTSNPSLSEIWLKMGQTISTMQYDTNVATIKYLSNITIEDAQFKAYCVQNFDTNGDGEISTIEAESVTEMYIKTLSITSLAGIEYFSNLTVLVCNGSGSKNGSNGGSLTNLNVTKNISLKELYCQGNKLTSLDVSKNTVLESLSCFENQLSSLDVSKNTALTELRCYSNQLTGLETSYNTALTELMCYSNQLTGLDVSKNTALKSLSCGHNQLKSIDLSNNTSLTWLNCNSTLLTQLDVSNNAILSYLNCTSNPSLTEIWLKPGQTVASFKYDTNVATIKYKDAANNKPVDLGLSVKWATCNVGATSPEEYGDYFAWGEITPYYNSLDPLTWKDGKTAGYALASYKWFDSTTSTYTKYIRTDYDTLQKEDDAAYTTMNGKFRMPTSDEFNELIATKTDTENYTWTWCDGSTTQYNGTTVKGWMIEVIKDGSTKGNTLFLPAAGRREGTGLYAVGSNGNYWTSSLGSANQSYGTRILFDSNTLTTNDIRRYYGFPIRPVTE